MRLKHIDLQVSDVDAARKFFETYFGLRTRYQRKQQIAFFEDETGFEFAISTLFIITRRRLHIRRISLWDSSWNARATYVNSMIVSKSPASP